MPDYVLAARQYLAAQPSVSAVLGADAKVGPWLFQMKPQVTVEGSQSVAAVLSPAGNWRTPNDYNTAKYPRLRLELFADPARDGLGNKLAASTWAKLVAAHDAIDPFLHWMSGERLWGDLRVAGSIRLGELDYSPVQDGDGGGYAVVYYGLTI